MFSAYYYETKIGKITVVEDGTGITHIFFGEELSEDVKITETDLLKKAGEQLQEYFNGERKKFDLPLVLKGTEFQQKVWRELGNIPYGEVCTYKDIAKNIGNIKACRAVGMANNKNPIPIIIPCHRVIGSNGKLVGYAGGLDIKENLLKIEKQKI